jgi:glycosyltransferase involved in cell wall biosynthesis
LLTAAFRPEWLPPWFPFAAQYFGRYSRMAQMPKTEIRNHIAVAHPRYPVIPKIGTFLSPLSLYFSTLSYLRNCRSEWDFDLIDAHYFYPDGVAAAKLGRALGKPVVITARGSDINLIARNPIPRRMIVDAARSAAAVIAVSRALKHSLIELGVLADRITVLRNGVDLETFAVGDRQIAQTELGVSGRVLLSVGNLVNFKGHDLAIMALRRLVDCTLLIAGEGPEFTRLNALARRLGVENRTRFLGSVPHVQLRNVYLAADALILASSREGWPNVLLEAMACGTPVIATATGGIPEIVSSPEAGLLLRARTPEAIADAIELLFDALPNRDVTRAFAEKFSWDDTSSGQIRLFKKILAADGKTNAATEHKGG